MRLKILRSIVFILLLMIAGNLFYAQVIRGWYYYALSMRNRIRVVPLEGVRGRIFDRKGEILADNQLTFNVSIVPQDIDDRRVLFDYLAKVIHVDSKELEQRFKRKFLTPFAPVVIAQDVPRDVAIEIEENKFRFSGLMIEESYRRIYPQGSIGAHVLGYVGKISRAKMEQFKDYGYTMQSIVGYSGIEEFYDDELRGDSGGRQIEIDNRGQEVRILGLRNPSVGKDVVLTIDHRIQEISDELLQGRRGVVIVMDMDNGEIFSMVSSPSYDPNDFVEANQRDQIDHYFHDAASPLLNRAIKGQFPPGSAFKIPVAIAALETGEISRNTTFVCPGYYAIADLKFGCSHVHNDQNLIQALAHSCNVYFFHTGLLVGSDEARRFARMLGLATKTNIDLPFEGEGAVPSKGLRHRGKWYTGDTLNFSIGQGGVLATPVQLLKMMSIVANRGKVVQPHLIQSIDGHAMNQYTKFTEIKLNPKTYDILEDGLRNVVEDSTGTANALFIPELKSFGKTGTAQAGGNRDDHAWFVGYTKSVNRKIAYCVFLENGGSSHNAVVLAHELLLRMRGIGII